MYPPGNNYGPQQPGYGQQPPQGYPPHGEYPPQYGGGYPQRPVPESTHEHPLNYQERLFGECKNCNRPINNLPGYKCDMCDIVLDMECSDRIFYGNKRKDVHQHPLGLRVRPSWRCDLCNRTFTNKCSFYCRPCDFDVCDQCYLIY
jgi:hypothetical protein